MKVLFNGMLSRDLVRRLSDLWPGSIQATAEYGENYPDEKLWAEAERLGMTIITKDHDYADAAKFPGPPPRVVRLTILNDRTLPRSLRPFASASEQPVSIEVRDEIRARQTWVLKVGHCHQASKWDPNV